MLFLVRKAQITCAEAGALRAAHVSDPQSKLKQPGMALLVHIHDEQHHENNKKKKTGQHHFHIAANLPKIFLAVVITDVLPHSIKTWFLSHNHKPRSHHQ